MSDVRIRAARAADADAVADVFLAARAQMSYLPVLHSEDDTRRWIRDVVLRDSEVWVARAGGRIVGFAALEDDLLGHLYVHPQAQRGGIGTALLGLAQDRRPHGFRLWVFQQNHGARRLYERHGFQLVRLTDGRENEEQVPDALYEWRGTPRLESPR